MNVKKERGTENGRMDYSVDRRMGNDRNFSADGGENVFPPIPSEIVLTCAGFLTTCSKLTKPQAIISATLGSLLGAVILYGLGRILPVEKLQKFGFKREEIESATAWFNKKRKDRGFALPMCSGCAQPDFASGWRRTDADEQLFAVDCFGNASMGCCSDSGGRSSRCFLEGSCWKVPL